METFQEFSSADKLLDEASTSLSTACNNLKGLLGDLKQSRESCNFASELQTLEKGLTKLRSNIEYITGPYIKTKNTEMASTLEELEAIRTKYRNLQREWDNQQEHLGRLQGEMFKMRAQLKNQSSFCASLGAIMGSLIWKTSRMPNVVDILLSTNRVSDFLCMVNGSLESFMETYSLTLPDTTTNEMQFILSLVGIIANMAATPDGRQFLVSDPNGRELITLLISTLPNIPQDSGDCLKRVMLMSLYNLSINQMGLMMLVDKTSLYEEMAKNINSETKPELRLLSLRLLQSLAMQIPSNQSFHIITDYIPTETLQELTNTTDADMRLLAKNILSSLERAATKFGSQIESQTSMAWDRCRQTSATNPSSCTVSHQ